MQKQNSVMKLPSWLWCWDLTRSHQISLYLIMRSHWYSPIFMQTLCKVCSSRCFLPFLTRSHCFSQDLAISHEFLRDLMRSQYPSTKILFLSNKDPQRSLIVQTLDWSNAPEEGFVIFRVETQGRNPLASCDSGTLEFCKRLDDAELVDVFHEFSWPLNTRRTVRWRLQVDSAGGSSTSSFVFGFEFRYHWQDHCTNWLRASSGPRWVRDLN
jgi:hypothetical protein